MNIFNLIKKSYFISKDDRLFIKFLMITKETLNELRLEKKLPKDIIVLSYESKEPGLLLKYKNYIISRQMIEIVPFKEDHFDIIIHHRLCKVNQRHILRFI